MTLAADLNAKIADAFDFVTDTALDTALGSSLPFVADAFTAVLTGGLPLLGTLQADLSAKLATLDALTDPVGIAAAINGLDGAIQAQANGHVITIHIGASDSFSTGVAGFDLNVGVEGLGFEIGVDASLTLGYALNLDFEYDTIAGTLTTKTGNGHEITLTLESYLDTNGKGQLGFINIDVADALPTTGPDKDAELSLSFGLDIDDNVEVAELSTANVDARISGGAHIKLGVTTDLSTTLLPTLHTNLVASYVVSNYDPSDGSTGLGATASLALTDITVDLGAFVDFLAGVFGPFIHEVFGSFPLGPLIDVLTTPLPIVDPALHALQLTEVFDKIGNDGIINLLDIAAQFGGDKDVLDAFALAFGLIKGIEAATGDGSHGVQIKLGDLVIAGDAPVNMLGAKPAGNNAIFDNAHDFTAASDPLGSAISELKDTLGTTSDPKSGLGGALTPLVNALSSIGLDIPLLSDPIKIVPLLLNHFGGQKPVDLIVYHVPELTFTAGYKQFFPIIGPIGVGIGGQLTAGIKINFGYDTSGIESGSFEQGFFLGTPEQPDDLDHPFAPAGTVGVEIDASAGINVGFIDIEIGGGIGANLSAYFHGTDGKLRLSALTDGCLFDPIAGEVDAKLFVGLSINFFFFEWSHRFDIADITLAEFEFGCMPPTTEDADPSHQGLATYDNLGTLFLNIGERADENRWISGKEVPNSGEHYEIRNANDPNDPNAVIVTAHTVNEVHVSGLVGAPLIINGAAGDERDVIVFGETVMASALISGGDGDDLFVGGAGADTLMGDDGIDHLVGGKGNDTLIGGKGDDVLEGGEGADFIDGEDGIDQVSYEHSKAGVIFSIDPENTDRYKGHGGEADGDVLTNVEYIVGSQFSDRIYANDGEDSTIEGRAGDDILIGGDHDDYILGGAGADTVHGGGGENGTSYLTSAGAIHIDLLGNVGHGGDAEGDQLFDIQDIQGSSGDDVITGNSAANKIDGWYGDDRIDGRGGSDEIMGGEGNDTIYGRASGAIIDGGGLASNKGRDLLSYERSTKEVEINLLTGGGDDEVTRLIVVKSKDPDVEDTIVTTVSSIEDLTGSNFDDELTGDNGYNTITGLNGVDIIKGMGGNDILIGGKGADELDGGTGIDTADYRTSDGNVTVNLLAGTGLYNHADGDQLALGTIENLRGSDFADTLVGNHGDNEIDPGLSRFGPTDIVAGNFGNDIMVLDYSRGDTGKGLVGGYAIGSVADGGFTREEAATAAQKDGVSFSSIERLVITGTGKDDAVFGGTGADNITTGLGNDLVFTGIGADRVFAGGGNDIVVSGTDADRQLSLAAGDVVTQIDGGAGIDTLSISLAAYQGDVALTGADGTKDFEGTNLVLDNGTAVSNFELLYAVVTDRGDDRITQLGVHDNFIVTGYGVDVIRSGLGKDYIDGGLDYRIGGEIAEPDPSGALVPAKSIDTIYANDGDLLILDYSSEAVAVVGQVTEAITAFTILDGNAARPIHTNNGVYTSGSNQVGFQNIERLIVTGSSANDVLVGTELLLGRNVGADGTIIASASRRGDDRLDGGKGDDFLIGNTGDDTLIGGDGDDLLVGAAIGSARGPLLDRGEIDHLSGGLGNDVFVLGTVIGSDRPIIYYNDGADSAVGIGLIGDGTASGSNRAVITDFSGGDRLLMAGIASDYRSEEVDGNTLIFLRDGVDGGGHAAPKNDELIAELEDVVGFRLDSAAVLYVGESAFANGGRVSVLTANVAGADATAAANTAGANHGAGYDVAARLAPLSVPVVPTVHAADAEQLAHLPVSPPMQAAPSANAPIPPASWVTQTNDPNDLRAALFDGAGPLSQGTFTIEGDAAAFGTFDGDPFGLGHGILLSTGQVTDLAGKNLVDGSVTVGPSADLNFVKIGDDGINTYYRAELTNLAFDLLSLKLVDSGSATGGSGGTASGFDLSALALSHARIDSMAPGDSLNDATLLPRIDAFSLDAGNVVFTPGSQRAPSGGYDNGPDLEGTINGMANFGQATLSSFDAAFLTLGDGGSIGFNLSQTVKTDGPLFLYVAERGSNGETLSTQFTASSDRLSTPADLSTDLGTPGEDSAALTYTFTPVGNKDVPDASINEVMFDFVFFSEELVEYAQSAFNDNFKITLNGVNMAMLSDGSIASVNTLFAPNAGANAASDVFALRTDTINSDFIYNPAGTGPAAGETRADGYSKVLHFKGLINPGVANVLRIEVNDVRDGLLDSGILIRGGSFTGLSVNEFFVDTLGRPVLEGEARDIAFGLHVPAGGHANGPLTVTLHPTDGLDLGAGAGHDVTRTLLANGTLSDHVTAVALADGKNDGSRIELVTISVAGSDAPIAGVAPLVFEIDDALVAVTRVIGDAPAKFSRAAPDAWHDAWTADGVHITHTADNSGRAPVFSAVDFGTANPKLLIGSDILAGDLGVSGQAKGTPGSAQEIQGNEALKFEFDSGSVSDLTFHLAKFDRGDVAKIDLYGDNGILIRSVSSTSANVSVGSLDHVADIVVSATSGAFVVHDLIFTEMFDPQVAADFAGDPHIFHPRELHPTHMGMNIESLHLLQIA